MNLRHAPPHLYKVSAPRADRTFYPGTFWHTPDWESSTTRYRAGYIRDEVLYTGDFDEVSIHLFPRVRVVRVRCADADSSVLQSLGLHCTAGLSACIGINHARRGEVEAFHPIVFKFHVHGFARVRRGEYVSRTPQRAISAERLSMAMAIERWNVEVSYVDDLDVVIERLRRKAIYFDEQT